MDRVIGGKGETTRLVEPTENTNIPISEELEVSTLLVFLDGHRLRQRRRKKGQYCLKIRILISKYETEDRGDGRVPGM